MPLRLVALLLLALPARAADSSDLSDQFPSACRAQGKTGACHSFAATALLEAAIKRGGGGVVELSDADLFVRSGLLMQLRIFEFPGEEYKVVSVEAGSPYKDLAVALSSGVAYQSTLPWERFERSFATFKANRDAACSRINKANPKAEDRLQGIKDYCAGPLSDMAKQERDLLGDPERLKKDRDEVRAKLGGLTIERRERGRGDFEPSEPTHVSNPGVCRDKGRKQTDVLVQQLDGRRPAIVCFDTDNLPGWDDDMDKASNGSHCAVIYGYDTSGSGAAARRQFKLRNSWGRRSFLLVFSEENTYDIDEDHACAIHGVFWLTP